MTVRLGELAVRFGCQLRGDPQATVVSVSTLEAAGPGNVAFLANPKYRKFLATTRATAVILDARNTPDCPAAVLLAANPYAVYARVAALLHPAPQAPPGVHASAIVAADAAIASSASIGAQVIIESGVRVGERAVIGAGCILQAGANIGADSRLVARVTICRGVVIGERTTVHPGCVIGADGFGFAREPEGWVKVPQVGGVHIGNDVEIGANTTIDRGAIEDTVIEDDVKLDNQIQVGHNVRIGAHTAIAGCVGISGSTVIGKRCLIGGAVGIVGHLTIADDVVITGLTMVSRSLTRAGVYSSALPVEEAKLFRRNAARFRHLDEWYRRGLKDGAGPADAHADEDPDD